MPSYSKLPLSQSENGKSILISLSALPGNLIHTAVNTTTGADEVWLYASNTTASDNITTIYWGSTATSDFLSQTNIQAYAGLTLLIPGIIINNSLQIYALTSSPSAVNISGYINRIS
jgi:hypothetical protein